jgi:nucleoside phosphorylase
MLAVHGRRGASLSDPVDIAVLVALAEEFHELLALVPPASSVPDPDYGGYAYRFELPAGEGRAAYRCVAALMGDMGPSAAGLATERLLSRWRPACVVMVGIAASLHEDLAVGDVLVATQVDAYLDKAKAVPDGQDGFRLLQRSTAHPVDYALVEKVKHLPFAHRALFQGWQTEGRGELSAIEGAAPLVTQGLVAPAPRLHRVHLASGPVVAASQAFGAWVRQANDNVRALEMEGAGLVAAAQERLQRVRALVIRGVSDLGDGRKSQLDAVGGGGLRRLAMRNAARLFITLARAGELPRRGAAIPLEQGPLPGEGDPEFIPRPSVEDRGLAALTESPDVPVGIFGPRECGRSTLLERVARRWQAEQPAGARVVRIRLDRFSIPDAPELEHVLAYLGQHVAYEAFGDGHDEAAAWEEVERASLPRFQRLLTKALAQGPQPLLLAVDDVDLFLDSHPELARAFFQVLRSWAMDHAPPYDRLVLLLAARHPVGRHRAMPTSPLANAVEIIDARRVAEAELSQHLSQRGLPAGPEDLAELMAATDGRVVLVRALAAAAERLEGGLPPGEGWVACLEPPAPEVSRVLERVRARLAAFPGRALGPAVQDWLTRSVPLLPEERSFLELLGVVGDEGRGPTLAAGVFAGLFP